MKIQQLLDTPSIIISNEEKKFIKQNGDNVLLSMLDEHNQWLAQNLVRKGVYAISKDKRSIFKND